MRYLGVDYGLKRVGLAVSDEDGEIAFPRETIERTTEARLLKDLRLIAIRERIEKIVLGLPLALDGKETGMSRKARKFADKLREETRREVALENEILTTRMAEQAGAGQKNADASAAALILQSYLDKANYEARSANHE